VNDFDRISMFVDMQNALARLTPEELTALDAEVLWVEKQKAAGRVPSPETLLAKAPFYMRVLADLGDDA
jgi:hypothetical protein